MRYVRTFACWMLLWAVSCGALAQGTWPARTLKVIIPYSAGSITDVIGRRVLDRLSQRLGQPIVVDNRPGASGTIGFIAGVKSPPDGYTIFVGSTSNLCVSPALGMQGPFDPAKDFLPVAMYARTPVVLLAHPSLGADSMKALVQMARSRQNPMQYATGGQTTTAHFVGEMLQRVVGIKLDHIPYKGATPALLAAVSGEVPLGLDFPATAAPQVAAGKLKALLVTGRSPVPLLPGVPTAVEAGYPALDIVAWMGFFLPVGTPRAIAEKLHAELMPVLASPELEAKLRDEGSMLTPLTLDGFREFVQADQARWARIVKETGVKAEP